MPHTILASSPVRSRSTPRRVCFGVGRIVCILILCSNITWAQSLDGATLDVRINGGDVQRYQLVAQNEPNGNPGELRFTFAGAMTPAAVHVHAMEIPLAAGETPLSVKYEWDFGDPEGRYNNLTGFNAAHIYDKPGVYTVKLRITDSKGAARQWSAKAHITADARRTIYADPSSFPAAIALLDDDTTLLLKRGHRYDVSKTINLNASNVVIGAHGDGADPVLVWSGNASGFMLATAPQSRDVMFQNVTFDALDPDAPAMAIRPQGRNLTIRNCTFARVDYAINSNAQPRGLLVIDNNAPRRDSIVNYFAWVAGEDHVYLGNTVANSLKAHVMRMSRFARVLAAKNDFSNQTFGGITVQKGSLAYVSDNLIRDCPITAGPLGGADGIRQDPLAGAARTSWVVIDGNRVIGDSINIGHGAQHVMVRNNRVERDRNSAVNVGGWDATYGRGVEDVWIMNNIARNGTTTGKFLKIEGNPLNDGSAQVTLSGNVYVAPNLEPGANGTAIVYVVGKDLRCFREISENIWPIVKPLAYAQGGVHYVWPKWSDSQGYRTPDEWRELGAKDERYENVPWLNE